MRSRVWKIELEWVKGHSLDLRFLYQIYNGSYIYHQYQYTTKFHTRRWNRTTSKMEWELTSSQAHSFVFIQTKTWKKLRSQMEVGFWFLKKISRPSLLVYRTVYEVVVVEEVQKSFYSNRIQVFYRYKNMICTKKWHLVYSQLIPPTIP